MTEDVFIVIPVLNGWEQTVQCLISLEASADSGFTVVVVDHGSTDETKSELPRKFPAVIHLLESQEMWWTAATNVGIRYAVEHGAAYVVLLNNDCLLSSPSLRELVALASREKAIVAPVQRAADSNEIRVVTARPALALGFIALRIETTIDLAAGELVDTELIMGGRGTVISREVFEEVGLFAEDELPHYHADTDFYLRCNRAGIPLKIAQKIEVLVDESRTSLAAAEAGAMNWSQFRESLTNPRSHRNLPALTAFFRRNYPIRALWPIGVFLYATRTALLWVVARSRAKLARGRT